MIRARAGLPILVFPALALFPFVFSAHWVVNIAIFTVMYAALATAWNLIGGYAGYLSLGHAAFFGLGAYGTAIWLTHISIGTGYFVFGLIPLVGIAVGIVSIPIGWIALRVREAAFAIVTISLLFVVQLLAFNLRGLTHGSTGILLPLPGFPVSSYERPFYWAMSVVFALSMLVSWYVQRSKLGLVLQTIRDDEDRAFGLGIDVTLAKVTAFALSCALSAMAGGVWAYYIGQVYPQFAVDPLVTIGAVLMAFLGGKGTLWGPALGAGILVPAQQYLAYKLGGSEWYLVSYAAIFLVIMLLLPRGIIPSARDWLRGRRGRTTGRAEVGPARVAS